jgi:hypothetical protein
VYHDNDRNSNFLPEGPDGFAESSADLLHDWFAEHSDDPEEGDPTTWPDWTDDDRVWLGSAKRREQAFDDLPPDVDDDTF